jgi:hypothetical protein
MSDTASIHPNLKLSSYSSRSTKRQCARKFQLYRLMPETEREETIDTRFGHAVGDGVQTLFITRSVKDAHWRMFLRWGESLFDGVDDETAKKRKSLFHAFAAVEAFTFFENLLEEYEVATYRDEHGVEHAAVELGAKIDLGDGFYERAKFDAVLRNKSNGRYTVLECKTTGMNFVHEAMYKNTGQGIGYSVVLDTIAHQHGQSVENFDVLYVVYQSTQMEWHQFRFRYSATDRLLWLKDVLLDKQETITYAETEYFPKNGASCFAYNRPCKYFDVCGMSDRVLIGDTSKLPVKEDKPEDYPFSYTIDELITAQLAKMEK